MPIFETSSIDSVIIHRVGNKATQEGFVLADKSIELNDSLREILIRYFISPFKSDDYYHLYNSDGDENEIFGLATSIFDNPECFVEQSQAFASRLYEASIHPNIKGGDLFVVYFSDCQINGEHVSAIGIFKSENKEQFLKVRHDDEEWSRGEADEFATAKFSIDIDKGININKLDKGALIFNSEKDNGYIVSVVDATNRGTDAIYWKDNFLQIKQREDEFFHTHQLMQAYKSFVTDELPQQFEVSKADQADLLNRSMNFFKQNEHFEMNDFARDVIGQPEVIDVFQNYRQQYEKENDVEIPETFDISESAVKKQSRSFKSVIKLDKNFHIYVHGNRELIEQGEDERGKFYKVYFKEES